MANYAGTLEVQIEDDNGLRNPATFYIVAADTMTLAQIQDIADDLVPLVAAVSDGATQKVVVTLNLAVNGGTSTPAAESNNQEGGLLTFYQANAIYAHSIFIPDYKDSLSTQGLIANTGATEDLTSYLASSPYTGLSFTSQFGNTLTAFERARTVFRRFAKQLARAASGRHNN